MVEIHDRSVFYWKFNYKLKNENIDEIKINNIRKIKFVDDYNFEIDNLPDGITHLFLPKNYDKSIDNLPNTITHIYLNDCYNKELNYLPSSVKFIQFNPSYDCKINNLNNNLRELKLPLYYSKKIDNLPNLDLLDIGIEFYRRINLPKTIKRLNIGESREPLSEIPMADLEKIDKFADKKLNPVDVVITDKHFFDRLNDPRNDKEISSAELIGFFKRLAKPEKLLNKSKDSSVIIL